MNNGFIDEKKCSGRVENLEKILFQRPSVGDLGIGHVRWATHEGQIELMHILIQQIRFLLFIMVLIENSDTLKKEYETKGYTFKSQTDTEVITIILTDFLKTEDLVDSVYKTLNKLVGSFALGVIFKNYKNLVVGARREVLWQLDMVIMKILLSRFICAKNSLRIKYLTWMMVTFVFNQKKK